MKRAQAVRRAKEQLMAWTSEYLRQGFGYDAKVLGVCYDDPKVVQLLVRVSHEECPDGETIQLEMRVSETIG